MSYSQDAVGEENNNSEDGRRATELECLFSEDHVVGRLLRVDGEDVAVLFQPVWG
jgi:hypothetical protein